MGVLMDYIKEIKTENVLQHVLNDSVGVTKFYHKLKMP